MQTVGKVGNNGESATKAWPENSSHEDVNMSNQLVLFTFALMADMMLMVGRVSAGQASATLVVPIPQIGNTRRNGRDSGNNTPAPEDQKETRGDLALTTAVRRTIFRNKSLSLDAHNAKVTTRNGVVTLRGPVENPAEKGKLQAIVQNTRGVEQVNNQLESKMH